MDSSSTPEKPLSFREQQELTKIDAEMAENLYIITLIHGELTDGNPQWAYLRITAEKYTAFKAAEMQGNYNTADFGELISHGAGLFPPESVKEAMAERYGTDDRFGDALVDIGLELAQHLGIESQE